MQHAAMIQGSPLKHGGDVVSLIGMSTNLNAREISRCFTTKSQVGPIESLGWSINRHLCIQTDEQRGEIQLEIF